MSTEVNSQVLQDGASGESPAAAVLTSRQRALSLAAVIASTVGIGVSYGIGYPLTSITFERWGVASWLTGVVGSAPALAIFVLLPFFPKLAGRLGAMVSMAIGCGVVAAGFLLMPLFQSPEAWLALRFLMGAGLALPWLVGETWINTVSTNANRGRMLALYSIALFSGFASGPVLLGQVGTSGWAPFLLGAAGVLLAVAPIVAARRLAPRLPRKTGTSVFGALWLAPVGMVAALIGGTLELGHFAMLAVYALQAGAPESEALGLVTVFMLGGIALQLPIGWLADRASARSVLLWSAALFAACVGLLPLAETTLLRGLVVFVMGGIAIGFYTLGLAFIGQRLRVQDLAVANAAFLICYQLGAMVGPSLGGFAMTLWSPHGFVVAMAGAALVGGALMLATSGDRR